MKSWIEKVKLYIRLAKDGGPALREAIRQGQIIKNVHANSSWKSTEFLSAVLVGLGAVLAQGSGLIPAPYGAIAVSLSASLYAISRGLAKNGDPAGGNKPGLATTERWATVIASLGQVVAASSGAVSPEVASILVALSEGAYAVSRGLAKGGAQLEQ